MVDSYSYFRLCIRLFCIGMLQYVVSPIIPFVILSLILLVGWQSSFSLCCCVCFHRLWQLILTSDESRRTSISWTKTTIDSDKRRKQNFQWCREPCFQLSRSTDRASARTQQQTAFIVGEAWFPSDRSLQLRRGPPRKHHYCWPRNCLVTSYNVCYEDVATIVASAYR
jgi:hypothetical protein